MRRFVSHAVNTWEMADEACKRNIETDKDGCDMIHIDIGIVDLGVRGTGHAGGRTISEPEIGVVGASLRLFVLIGRMGR